MKMIPLFRTRNMKEAIAFYTNILDFELREPGASPDDWVVLLTNGDAELMLTSLEGDQKIGIATNVLVDNIDELFEKYKKLLETIRPLRLTRSQDTVSFCVLGH